MTRRGLLLLGVTLAIVALIALTPRSAPHYLTTCLWEGWEPGHYRLMGCQR